MRAFQQRHQPSAIAVGEATLRYRAHDSQRYRAELAEGGNVYEVVDGEANHPHDKVMCRTTFDKAERIVEALNLQHFNSTIVNRS